MKKYFDFVFEKKIPDIDKKLINQYGKIKVYSVNGKKVRDISKSAEEFGLSSVHGCFPNLIPKNEIWIEDDVKKDEIRFLIYSSLYHLKLIEDGLEPWTAYKKSNEYEKKLRKHQSGKPNKKEYEPKNEYCKIDNISVYLVNGKKVRDYYKTDFMEGGHDYVYEWIPKNEIWIEDGLKEKEIPLIVLHEYVERSLMEEKGMKYDDAHEIASKVEWNKRPDKFTKEDAEKLTSKKALQMTDV